MRVFQRHGLPLTVFGVARALERNPDAAAAISAAGHEVAGHGLRWISYQSSTRPPRLQTWPRPSACYSAPGRAPVGWYTGRDSPNTRRLVVEHGGFLYDSDSYADDLPYWVHVDGTTTSSCPTRWTPTTCDLLRSAGSQPVISGSSTVVTPLTCCGGRDRTGSPKMLSIGLHGRIIGRPGRVAALERLVDHILSRDRVWVCRRADIASHWKTHFPHPTDQLSGGPQRNGRFRSSLQLH